MLEKREQMMQRTSTSSQAIRRWNEDDNRLESTLLNNLQLAYCFTRYIGHNGGQDSARGDFIELNAKLWLTGG
jgi:hypothetical protein